jgi:hypothetical protein
MNFISFTSMKMTITKTDKFFLARINKSGKESLAYRICGAPRLVNEG